MEPEVHHHKTGHSKADLILGCLAVVLSMVSVFIAMRDNRTMERMVAASTWPNISYGTDNDTKEAPNTITLNLKNTGVGPARLETLELFYKGKPMSSSVEFLRSCCGKGHRSYGISEWRDDVLPARDEISLISFPAQGNDPAVWATLNAERMNVRLRVCYCSVFDECWVEDTDAARPKRVEQCTQSQLVGYTH
jgi:hypothetical protein